MKKKLLIVDDEASRFARILPLLMPEYDLRFEENGIQAYSTAVEYGPDVFLLDLIMPQISGLELAAKLRTDARFAVTPIIIVSGTVRSAFDDAPVQVGSFPAFGKPINMSALKKCIEQQIALASRGQPPTGGRA